MNQPSTGDAAAVLVSHVATVIGTGHPGAGA